MSSYFKALKAFPERGRYLDTVDRFYCQRLIDSKMWHGSTTFQGAPNAKSGASGDITERAASVSGLPDEQPRYYLQHAMGFQVHDAAHPHHPRQHGRANIGWEGAQDD